MNKTKILIQIFSMAKDIDYLERTLMFLKQSSPYINKQKYHIILDVTLPLSDYLIDWDSSILKKDYFLNKFEHFKKYGDCWDECHFNIDYTTYGLLDNFTKKLHQYNDVDSVIILETDIIFNPFTLNLLIEASSQISHTSPEHILTPEHTKLWDSSWNIITNSKFIDFPFNYRDFGDALFDTIPDEEEIKIQPLVDNENRYFKFGGGWFTLYSKKLLDQINFPLTLKGYGPLDYFITKYCYLSSNPIQYIVRNLVITEDCKYTKPSLYDNYISLIDRKKDLYEENINIMENHFKNKFDF